MIFRASAGSVVRGRQSSPTCSRQCQWVGPRRHRLGGPRRISLWSVRRCGRRQCEQGTGKAGENGQYSRTVGRPARTRPSVARLLLVDLWESSLGVIAIDWVAGRSCLEIAACSKWSSSRCGSMFSQAATRKRREVCTRVAALRDRAAEKVSSGSAATRCTQHVSSQAQQQSQHRTQAGSHNCRKPQQSTAAVWVIWCAVCAHSGVYVCFEARVHVCAAGRTCGKVVARAATRRVAARGPVSHVCAVACRVG